MNIQQKNKTATQYTTEVEKLTKDIQGAYISDGVPPLMATRYSTKAAVSAMIKNCNIHNVQMIMKSGNFSSLNEATQKFVESCTDETGKSDTILHYSHQGNNFRGNYRGNYRGYYRGNNSFRSRGRGNYNYRNSNPQAYSGNGNYNSSSRNQNNGYNNNNSYRGGRSYNNVRQIDT